MSKSHIQGLLDDNYGDIVRFTDAPACHRVLLTSVTHW